MKIFDKDFKVNFVDENNVFLGYDMGQDCCEYANWFISGKLAECSSEYEEDHTRPDDLDGWVFDKEFFQDICYVGNDYDPLDQGGMVAFRITKGEEEAFIHLFNAHNGYYGHGFDFKIGENVIQSGGL